MTQTTPAISITHEDIPLIMKLLGFATTKEFADQLGITTRSLMSHVDEPMQPWRKMSIECLLRRAGKWEVFCDLRSHPAERDQRASVTGYRCVICNQCIERMSDAELTGRSE